MPISHHDHLPPSSSALAIIPISKPPPPLSLSNHANQLSWPPLSLSHHTYQPLYVSAIIPISPPSALAFMLSFQSHNLHSHQPSWPPSPLVLRLSHQKPSTFATFKTFCLFSCKSNSTITNVCLSAKPLKSLKSSFFIILHSSFLHFATF